MSYKRVHIRLDISCEHFMAFLIPFKFYFKKINKIIERFPDINLIEFQSICSKFKL